MERTHGSTNVKTGSQNEYLALLSCLSYLPLPPFASDQCGIEASLLLKQVIVAALFHHLSFVDEIILSAFSVCVLSQSSFYHGDSHLELAGPTTLCIEGRKKQQQKNTVVNHFLSIYLDAPLLSLYIYIPSPSFHTHRRAYNIETLGMGLGKRLHLYHICVTSNTVMLVYYHYSIRAVHV